MKINKKIVIIYIITIGIILLGITFALVSQDVNLSIKTADISVEYDDGNNGVIDLSNIDLYPILDKDVDTNNNNVIRINFSVGGKDTNPDNTIYDISLKDLNIDSSLINKYVKWKLLKNDALISQGNFSKEFDTITNNRLVLTEIQQDLTPSGSKDNYEFVLWLSDACQEEDITKCIDTENQDHLYNKKLSGKIEVEVYTGNKKALVRKPAESKTTDTTQ